MSPLTLGIDTGGTFTDAALLATAAGAGVTVPAAGAATSVLASAKALTTRDNLLTGITKAVDAVFKAAPAGRVSRVRLVGLSTTLATNAIVAGHGSPACLLLIGQPPGILQRADLGLALGGGPAVFVDGGHNAAGDEQAALDTAALARAAFAAARAEAEAADGVYHAVESGGLAGLRGRQKPQRQVEQQRGAARAGHHGGHQKQPAHQGQRNLELPRHGCADPGDHALGAALPFGQLAPPLLKGRVLHGSALRARFANAGGRSIQSFRRPRRRRAIPHAAQGASQGRLP